jgi:hypothetical protein
MPAPGSSGYEGRRHAWVDILREVALNLRQRGAKHGTQPAQFSSVTAGPRNLIQ